jgi:hypothetical protein
MEKKGGARGCPKSDGQPLDFFKRHDSIGV